MKVQGLTTSFCVCDAISQIPLGCELNGIKYPLITPRKSLQNLTQIASQVESLPTGRALSKSLTMVRQGLQLLGGVFDPSDITSFDIIHFPVYRPLGFRTPPNTKTFVTIYDLIPVKFPHWFPKGKGINFLRALNRLVKSDSFVLCISEQTKKDLIEITGIHSERVFVTYLGADDEIFYPNYNLSQWEMIRGKFNLPDTPYLLSLCTLEPRKNLAHLIRCFARVVSNTRMKDLSLVLVGAYGWDADDVFRMTELSGIKNKIHFTGFVPDEYLSTIYSHATAFVYPSLYEGFGLPILEAMQCGIPVITSNISSLPEVIGDTGIMVSPTKEDDLCEAITKFVTDHNLREKCSNKSLERSKQFSWDTCIKQTLMAYNSVL